MPKSSPGRNAADGKNHRFLKGNYREKAAFRGGEYASFQQRPAASPSAPGG
jgi:hypothetical protein